MSRRMALSHPAVSAPRPPLIPAQTAVTQPDFAASTASACPPTAASSSPSVSPTRSRRVTVPKGVARVPRSGSSARAKPTMAVSGLSGPVRIVCQGAKIGRDPRSIERSIGVDIARTDLGDGLADAGASEIMVGIDGPGYDFGPVKDWLAWRDGHNAARA